MKATYEIIQIIPPTPIPPIPGWALVCREEGGGGKCYFLRPLAFALVDIKWEDGKKHRFVTGIDEHGDVAGEVDAYRGLVYLGDNMDKLNDLDELPPNSMIEL